MALAKRTGETGTITAVSEAVTFDLQGTYAVCGVELSGTWVGTLQFEGLIGVTWTSVNATPPTTTTAVTSSTANGRWIVSTAGLSQIRVRASAWTSGTATISLAATQSGGSAGGSGGGAVTVADGANAALGTTTDTPSTSAEDATARTGISLLKGIKNYVRTISSLILGAGEAHVGEVGGSSTIIQATCGGATAVAAAGNYAANDVVSNDADNTEGAPWLFTGLARVSGGTGIITGLTATCSATTVVWRLRLWLFDSAPTTTELDDNAAFALDADDRSKVIGHIDLPAMANVGEVAVAQNHDARLLFKASGSANIYGVLQAIDAETNEAASMTITLRLHAVRD